MKVENIVPVTTGLLKPLLVVTFECQDQQELDQQSATIQQIMDTRLEAAVGGYRKE